MLIDHDVPAPPRAPYFYGVDEANAHDAGWTAGWKEGRRAGFADGERATAYVCDCDDGDSVDWHGPLARVLPDNVPADDPAKVAAYIEALRDRFARMERRAG